MTILVSNQKRRSWPLALAFLITGLGLLICILTGLPLLWTLALLFSFVLIGGGVVYARLGLPEKKVLKRRLISGLAGGKFPCGTFGANAAWWRITCLTHNLIQALKILALPAEWFYTRMKALRFRLFCIAGRIIKHARQIILQLARGHPILPIYQEARLKLSAFAE